MGIPLLLETTISRAHRFDLNMKGRCAFSCRKQSTPTPLTNVNAKSYRISSAKHSRSVAHFALIFWGPFCLEARVNTIWQTGEFFQKRTEEQQKA